MFPWLDFLDGMKMVCKSCKSQEEKLQLMPGANLMFMTDSINYYPSMLKDHAQTDGHKQAVGEEAHAEAEASGMSLQAHKVYQTVPSSSSIVQGLNRMGDNEQESATKESAKLRALHAKNVLTCQCALHAYMPTCQHALHTYLLTCQHALHAYMFTCQHALHAYVLTCQRALHAYVLTCQCALCAHVPTC